MTYTDYDFDAYVYTDADAPPLEDAPPMEPPPEPKKPLEGYWTNTRDPFLSCFKSLDQFPEQEADWLVEGLIPWGQITLLAGDGGVGKTTLWVDLAAAVTNGDPSFLEPNGKRGCSMPVLILTAEDSIRKKLKKKLRLAGAWMPKIVAPDFAEDRDGELRALKFGTAELEYLIRHFRPALCVFDPIQAFVPPDINMGSRNAMRDCLAPLVALGEDTGCTFLIVCHTNKRKGASGRDRIADSADLWDIARSVLMVGYAGEQGVRYVSNEKNNYAPLQETRLFALEEEGRIVDRGRTWKRDRDFAQETAQATSAPKREDCKAWVLDTLDVYGGSVASKELEKLAEEEGFSYHTLRRVKDEMKSKGEIEYYQVGSNKDRVWYVRLLTPPSGTPKWANAPSNH